MLKFLSSLVMPATPIEPPPLPEVPDLAESIDGAPEVAAARAAALAASAAVRAALEEADKLDATAEALAAERTALGPAILRGDDAAKRRSAEILREQAAARGDAAAIRDAVRTAAEPAAAEAAFAFVAARERVGQDVARAIETGPLARARARYDALRAELDASAARANVLGRLVRDALDRALRPENRPTLHGTPAALRAQVLAPQPGEFFEDVAEALRDLAECERIAGASAEKLRMKYDPHLRTLDVTGNPWSVGHPAVAAIGLVCAATRERQRVREATLSARRTADRAARAGQRVIRTG